MNFYNILDKVIIGFLVIDKYNLNKDKDVIKSITIMIKNLYDYADKNSEFQMNVIKFYKDKLDTM